MYMHLQIHCENKQAYSIDCKLSGLAARRIKTCQKDNNENENNYDAENQS